MCKTGSIKNFEIKTDLSNQMAIESPPKMEEEADNNNDQNMEEDNEEEEEQVSYHPSAPSSQPELFDMQTTVDPSYIISLIRKLLPHTHSNNKNAVEAMDIQTQTNEDKAVSYVDEAAWEESGCILWDLAVNKNHALLMLENLLLEVLFASLTVSQSARVTEIGLGILANIACHQVLRNKLVSVPGLVGIVVDQLFLDDSMCLYEAFRLLALGVQGSGSVEWAKALQPEHILSRIFWVAENTLVPQLLEKTTGLLLVIADSQQETSEILLPHLMKLGLPNLLISLLACEMKHLSSERVPERYSVLDTLLRVIEALSVLDDYSKVISSNKELVQLVYDLIKLPDKAEVSNSCLTAVVLIANILTDEPNLASEASQDLPLLQGLLGLLPFVSSDIEVRRALWSVLGRLLVCINEDRMIQSSLQQIVAILVDKADFIEDDIIDHCDEDCNGATSRITSFSRIYSILRRWTEVSENMIEKDTIGVGHDDDETVQKLLKCCQK